ncbi:MAG: hypothetical protein ACREPR_09345 [Brasilonema sp.]
MEVVQTEGGLTEVQSFSDTKAPACDEKTVSNKDVDYSTYPHRTSNDIRAKEKRANKCLESMLACTNKKELARFRSELGFSNTEIDWVYRQALTPSEQQKVSGAATSDQLNLLSQPVYEFGLWTK